MLTNRLLNIVISMAFMSFTTWVQAQASQFIGQNSSTPISEEEGRFLEFSNLVSINFLKDSTQTYIVEGDETLVLDQSKHYVYDAQGFEQYYVVKKITEAKWVNSALVENSYNFDQLISEQHGYKWDMENQDWISTSLLQFEYNNFKLRTEILEKKMEAMVWLNSMKKTFEYGPEQLVDIETIYSWIGSDSEWIAETRTLFTYNDDDAIEIEVIQQWNDTMLVWENLISREFVYNNEKKVESSTRSIWEDGLGWVKSSVLALHYNDEGQLETTRRSSIENNETADAQHSEIANYSDEGYLGETIQSTWDEESGSWEIYKKEVHFWSEHYNGVLVINENEIDCKFANPYLLGLPWYCDNLKNDVDYTIEVIDMWGRSFYKGQIFNNATFRLNGSIPPGLYNVLIQGGLDRHTEKVLIRN